MDMPGVAAVGALREEEEGVIGAEAEAVTGAAEEEVVVVAREPGTGRVKDTTLGIKKRTFLHYFFLLYSQRIMAF